MRGSLVFVEFLSPCRDGELLQPGRTVARAIGCGGAGSACSVPGSSIWSSPGPPPALHLAARFCRTYVRDNEGMKGTIRRRREDGREEVIEYRADFDREYPVMGTAAYDTIVSNKSMRARRRPSSHTRGVCLEQRGARSPRMAELSRSRSVKRTRNSRATSPSIGKSRAASSSFSMISRSPPGLPSVRHQIRNELEGE